METQTRIRTIEVQKGVPDQNWYKYKNDQRVSVQHNYPFIRAEYRVSLEETVTSQIYIRNGNKLSSWSNNVRTRCSLLLESIHILSCIEPWWRGSSVAPEICWIFLYNFDLPTIKNYLGPFQLLSFLWFELLAGWRKPFCMGATLFDVFLHLTAHASLNVPRTSLHMLFWSNKNQTDVLTFPCSTEN